MHYQHPLEDEDKQRLDDLYNQLTAASSAYSGYPASLAYDYRELYRFLDFSINNIGDPKGFSNYQVNTHEFEAEVIDFFAQLLHVEFDYRGYVTNGGTEGNLYGLYLATRHFPDAIVYYSESSHYSIEKILRIIKANSIKVPTLENGEINCDTLSMILESNKNKPAVFLVNIGSTMTGAIDNLDKIKSILNALNITDYYLHCDAALHGCILPFVENPQPFDFAAGIDSISISGHKLIGSPIPCGVVITKDQYLRNLSVEIAYVKIVDSTISGSRNGLTSLFLWYAIKRFGMDGFKRMIAYCLQLTDYVVDGINSHGINAWSNPNSIIAVFPKPCERIVEKWQIATYEKIAHCIILPHHSKQFFDELIADLANNND